MKREADREHQRQRDEKDQPFRAAAQPQMTGAGNGPRREAQQDERTRLRLFSGGGTHDWLVYITEQTIHATADRVGRRDRADRAPGASAGREIRTARVTVVGAAATATPRASCSSSGVRADAGAPRRRRGDRGEDERRTRRAEGNPQATRADGHLGPEEGERPLRPLMTHQPPMAYITRPPVAPLEAAASHAERRHREGDRPADHRHGGARASTRVTWGGCW